MDAASESVTGAHCVRVSHGRWPACWRSRLPWQCAARQPARGTARLSRVGASRGLAHLAQARPPPPCPCCCRGRRLSLADTPVRLTRPCAFSLRATPQPKPPATRWGRPRGCHKDRCAWRGREAARACPRAVGSLPCQQAGVAPALPVGRHQEKEWDGVDPAQALKLARNRSTADRKSCRRSTRFCGARQSPLQST